MYHNFATSFGNAKEFNANNKYESPQWRSVGRRRPVCGLQFCHPKSRKIPAAPLSPPFLPPLLIVARGYLPLLPPRYATECTVDQEL